MGQEDYREFVVRIHKSMEKVYWLVHEHVARSQAEAGWPLSSRKPLARGRVIELIFADFLGGLQQPIASRCARVEASAALLLSLNGEELQMLLKLLEERFDDDEPDGNNP